MFLTFSLHPGSERVHTLLSPTHQPPLWPRGRGWGEHWPRVGNPALCPASPHVFLPVSRAVVFSRWRRHYSHEMCVSSQRCWSHLFIRQFLICWTPSVVNCFAGSVKLGDWSWWKRSHADDTLMWVISTDTWTAVCNRKKLPLMKPWSFFCSLKASFPERLQIRFTMCHVVVWCKFFTSRQWYNIIVLYLPGCSFSKTPTPCGSA